MKLVISRSRRVYQCLLKEDSAERLDMDLSAVRTCSLALSFTCPDCYYHCVVISISSHESLTSEELKLVPYVAVFLSQINTYN